MPEALVFGASGISGWAVTFALLHATQPAFTRVTGLTNRPLSIADSGPPPDDPRLSLISGIDLSHSATSTQSQLIEKVPHIATVTHVYFYAYTSAPTHAALVTANVALLKHTIEAATAVCTNLAWFTLQTGSKAYGTEFSALTTIPPTPLSESAPRIPAPISDNIFYYPQIDLLAAAASQNTWGWADIRPDVIVGFVPKGNVMNIAQPLALYLSLVRRLRGAEAEVPFPGTQKSWVNKHTDTSQGILAQFAVHISTNDKVKSGETWNIADGPATTWKHKWPLICMWFGLRGRRPTEDGERDGPRKWWEAHQNEYQTMVRGKRLQPREIGNGAWDFVETVCWGFDVDRDYDLSKARDVAGWTEEDTPMSGWWLAFEMMADARVVPRYRYNE